MILRPGWCCCAAGLVCRVLVQHVDLGGVVCLQVDTSTLKPAEWERLRTGIALKTFTTLMKRQVVVAYASLQGVPLHGVCSVSH